MPELIEVELARAVIAGHALHRVIADVDDADDYVCRPHARGEIADALVGHTFTDACRRGKAMWLPVGGGAPPLGLHLGMAGRIVVVDADGRRHVGPGTLRSAPKTPKNPAWDRFAVTFEDGGTLALRDKRRLGRVRLDPDVDALGPDAADITRAQLRAVLARGRGPLKGRLLDQGAVAGVGNLLADEVLWQARLSPTRASNSLSDDEADALRRALRAAIRHATRLGGVHHGEIVTHRRRDGHCPRCGAPMSRTTVGGRTTWFCSDEQA